MTTVRLPVEYEQKLEYLAQIKNTSKSDIIKEALDVLFKREETEIDSFTLGEPCFGVYGSGDGTLSTTYKRRIKDKINGKRDTH